MGSIVVNDVTDSILRSANIPVHTAGFTISGWVKFTTSSAGTNRIICSIATNGSTSGADLRQWTDNTYSAAGATLGNPVSPAPADDVWVYVALTGATANGAPTMRWWNASGTLQDTQAGADPGSGTGLYLCVGNEGRLLDRGRVGKYAYWKVWDEELTQGQIEADMFSPTVVRTTNFNTGFADSATDIGPNGRNWTLSGTGTDSDTPPVDLGADLIRYNSFAEDMADGTIDMDNDTFKVCLVTSSYTPSLTHTQLSDVSTYRVSGTTDTALTSVTWAQTSGTAKFDAADTDVVFSTTQGVKYAVIYSDTSTNDKLVGYVVLPDSTTITGGDTLRLVWDSAGIFTLA
jgi:hypothetical protein